MKCPDCGKEHMKGKRCNKCSSIASNLRARRMCGVECGKCGFALKVLIFTPFKCRISTLGAEVGHNLQLKLLSHQRNNIVMKCSDCGTNFEVKKKDKALRAVLDNPGKMHNINFKAKVVECPECKQHFTCEEDIASAIESFEQEHKKLCK